MDTHNMLNDIAFHNLRTLRKYINHLTDDRYILISRNYEDGAEIQLDFKEEVSRMYSAPTHLEIAPIIYFTFNQVINCLRTRHSEFNDHTQTQIEGLHSLLDTAHCAIGELINDLPNPDKTTILRNYSEDIGLKLDKIYERNVQMTCCRYVFEPVYNVFYNKLYDGIKYVFNGR
jgi:hypothetical protein